MIGFWRNRLYQLPCCSFFHHKRSTAPSLSWSINSTLTLYGCNTGLTGSVRDFSIADVFHERQKTKIIAQRGYAYFSEQEDTYTKTSIDSLSIFLWAYNRGQNSILGSGEKIPPQIIEM